MAKGGGGASQREGNALKTAVVVTGGLVLAWITVEAAFKPLLDRLRAAVTRSNDPDQAPAASAAEPSAPPLPAEEEEGEKKGEDKEVELEEKGEGAGAGAAKAE